MTGSHSSQLSSCLATTTRARRLPITGTVAATTSASSLRQSVINALQLHSIEDIGRGSISDKSQNYSVTATYYDDSSLGES